jgi:hypothetical protein
MPPFNFIIYHDNQKHPKKCKMKKSWTRKILGGLSFTTALFVFQACYGTPQDFGDDLYISGEVRSKNTGQLIQGIKVTAENSAQYEITDFSGHYSLHTARADNLKITFEDIDGISNGEFVKKDTVITPVDFDFRLDVSLAAR